MFKRKKCKNCECDNPVWSDGLCKNHISKKPMKSVVEKMRPYSRSQELNRVEYTFKQQTFFLDVWIERPHISEVSGASLGSEALSIFFHHILPKKKYPQADLDKDNIILLTFDEHQDVESDMYKFEEVNKRRALLIEKYDL